MARYHVGVDVGKDRHHVCIRGLSRDTYCTSFSVRNNREGFAELVFSLERLSTDKDDFVTGVESCAYGLNLGYFLRVAHLLAAA